MKQPITLTINGESRQLAPMENATELLATLGLDPRGVVVEINRQIIRRVALAGTPVKQGDTIEIVHFVGGG